jgi:hypothetical protein
MQAWLGLVMTALSLKGRTRGANSSISSVAEADRSEIGECPKYLHMIVICIITEMRHYRKYLLWLGPRHCKFFYGKF